MPRNRFRLNLSSRIVLALLATASGFADVEAASKPNIVFFFIDDMGWTDVGYMYDHLNRKQRFYETPNIDRLAGQGTMFTDAYANAPNCAPSRACLMSGKYGPRHGIYTVGDPRRGNHRFRKLEPTENKTVLDESFVTIAEALAGNGYTCATMGKWQLGDDPTRQGFHVNVAGKQWGSPSGGGYHSPLNYPNLVVKEKGVYLTDALTDRAVDFIDTQKDKPFFLYLTHYAVHTPIQGRADLVAKYREKTPTQHHSNAAYAAMVESVDMSVGRVLKQLDDLQLAENTLVVFFSDNGGFGGATSNHPLRGAKGMLYEGGIREPMIVRWPGVTRPGSQCHEPVIGIDLYPTFLEATGTARPKNYELDGLSLVPLLKGTEAKSSAKLDRTAIFWHFPCYLQGSGDPHGGPFRTTPAGAIRAGDWKLIEWFETGRLELYNLKTDLGESRNLADSNPDKLAELHAAMKQWRDQVSAPIPTHPNPRYDPNAKPDGKAKSKTKRKLIKQ
ncbi:MAG: sulfatase [Planctomycetota bacterium]|nr:sulfatase [Planctomycetota bacterium]